MPIRITLPIIVVATTLSAHDMWIEPTTFLPQPGQIVGAKLRVGQDLLGDPIPRDPALINQFIVEDAVGRKAVIGRIGGDPAGILLAAPGLQVIGYRSNPSTLDQTLDKFRHYLKEEGLEAIAAARPRPSGAPATVLELYARCAKSLVLSGPPASNQGDRALGFTVELVAERNPYMLRAGDELPVRLTYEGKPLAGALVVAMNRANPMEKLRARSDKDGRVRFRLSGDGMWLIKAVHLIPAPADTKAEWMSYWASLTFEMRPAVVASK